MKVNDRLNDRMKIEGYVTIAEAVERSGIARSTIYDATLKGKIEHTTVGKRRYLLENSLLEFLGPVVARFYREKSVPVAVEEKKNESPRKKPSRRRSKTDTRAAV